MALWTGDGTDGATTGSDTPDGPLWTSVSDRLTAGVTSQQLANLGITTTGDGGPTGDGGNVEVPVLGSVPAVLIALALGAAVLIGVR